ncbi:MAG TPA: sigma-70 family RNA polymerase sigma factor [Candidatus Eisenbacteria bacterium]
MSAPKSHTRIWMDEGVEVERVRAAQRGDDAAFRELARHHLRHVYRLAFALTRDRDDATELTAETFERARAGIKGLPPGKRFFPWLLRITRNLSVTLARRRAGEPVLVNARAWKPGDAAPEDVEAELRVLRALPELRPDEQMALALRVVERLSYEEIAALLDHTVAVTIARLSSARGLLLARDGGGEAPEP